MRDLLDKKSICNKNVCIVESHHHVLFAWAEFRRTVTDPPFLISLDYHEDNIIPFRSYLAHDRTSVIPREEHQYLAEQIDFANESTIEEAIDKLKHDEHIWTATATDIIKAAFVINYQSGSDEPLSVEEQAYINSQSWEKIVKGIPPIPKPKRPFTYNRPENNIYILSSDCFIGCTKQPHNDSCTKQHRDQAIETEYLQDKINKIHEMAGSHFGFENILDASYILDIDLDYFGTVDSVSPLSLDLFYKLIQKAEIITVARECNYVQLCKLEGEGIGCDFLQTKIEEHIRAALEQVSGK